MRPRHQVLQQPPRHHARHDDRDRGREPLEDVVSVLDGGGHHQAADGLEHDDGEDGRGVAVEDAVLEDVRAGVVNHRREGEQQREDAELQVPDDDGGLAALLHQLLVEHPGVARGEAGGQHRAEPDQAVVSSLGVRGGGGRGELHHRHARHQQHEGHPLPPGELLVEEEDGEARGGEDLELVGDLVGGRVQVGERHDQEVVLQRVEAGGHTQQHSLPGGQGLIKQNKLTIY